VILEYAAEASVATAAAKLASGEAAFVGLDGRIPDAKKDLFPAGVVEVPVAGGALVVVYNLPGSPAMVRTMFRLRVVWPELSSHRSWVGDRWATTTTRFSMPPRSRQSGREV
jgi:hypothetical protein